MQDWDKIKNEMIWLIEHVFIVKYNVKPHTNYDVKMFRGRQIHTRFWYRTVAIFRLKLESMIQVSNPKLWELMTIPPAILHMCNTNQTLYWFESFSSVCRIGHFGSFFCSNNKKWKIKISYIQFVDKFEHIGVFGSTVGISTPLVLSTNGHLTGLLCVLSAFSLCAFPFIQSQNLILFYKFLM